MSLISWAAAKLGYEKRASAPRPIDIWPDQTAFYGNGLTYQPSAATLLSESVGIPDAATRAIANRIASLPLEVYVERRVTGGTTEDEILDDHPMKLLLDKPHPNLSRAQTLRLTAQYIVTVGEAYWIKVGNGLGMPTELHIVPPGMVRPLVSSNVIRAYEVTDANGRRSEYPPEVFVRMYFPDPEDPWRSEGYLGPSGIAADAHKFATQHLRAHYQYDAVPKVVLEAQADATGWEPEEAERFYQVWQERLNSRGGSRLGVPPIGPSGYKFIELALKSGADVRPLLEYFRDDLLMGYQVPRAVLGNTVAGDRSTAEAMQYVFDRYAVSPVTDLIADGLTMALAPDFDPSLRVRFCEFVSDDADLRLREEQQDLAQKVRTVNEVRHARGLDPVAWGDDPIGTSADVPYDPEAAAERVNRPPEPPAAKGPNDPMGDDEEPEGDEERSRLERRIHAIVRREVKKRVKSADRVSRRVDLLRDAEGNVTGARVEDAA